MKLEHFGNDIHLCQDIQHTVTLKVNLTTPIVSPAALCSCHQ